MSGAVTLPTEGAAIPRVLVAAVGNVLRRDDGFGPAVVERLGRVPDDVHVVETGIGGIALLQELMAGYDGVIVLDAVDRGAAPGTLFVVEPEVGEARGVPDLHQADPERVFALAKALGCLPPRVLVVGCQPAETEDLGEELSPEVERAVEVAAERVRSVLADWLAATG